MKTILVAVMFGVSIPFCFAQTPAAAKPGIIVEQEGGKAIAHLTLPGTKVRDWSKPSFILEKSGDTLTAYPTLAGTSVRDYSKEPITFDTQRKEVVSNRETESPVSKRTVPSVTSGIAPFPRLQKESQNAYSSDIGSSPGLNSIQRSPMVTDSEPTSLPALKPFPKVGGTTVAPLNEGSTLGSVNLNRYDPNSLANPYGAGSPYKADGLMNPYSRYGSPYSPNSWNNPYATDTPKLVDQSGNYRGKLSSNPYDPDSVSNPYGRYGSRYSPDSVNNPYGAGNPYSTTPIHVVKPKK